MIFAKDDFAETVLEYGFGAFLVIVAAAILAAVFVAAVKWVIEIWRE